MLPDAERYKLLGTYAAPPVHRGDHVTCERLGDCFVVGMSASPIPWPMGRRADGPKSARASVLLCGSLVDAVKRESAQAVGAWWGVNATTVSRWRVLLGVKRTDEGTRRLLVEDRDRAEKIGAGKVGKARPPEVMRRLHEGNRGRPQGDEAKAKRRESHRKLGTRPPAAGKPFAPEEDEIIRTHSGVDAARLLGRSLGAVYERRCYLGLPDGRFKLVRPRTSKRGR